MARTTRGRIFQRGKTKVWYLEFHSDGQRFVKSLEAKTRRQAEQEQKRIVAPYVAGQTVKVLEHQLSDARQEHGDLQDAARDKLKFADTWEAYVADKRRPQSGALTLKDYQQQWDKFLRWWKAENEDGRPYLEDVTREDGAKFVAFLESEKLSPNRFNKIIQTCMRVCRILAPQCGDMPNPFVDLARKRLVTQGRRELTEAELTAVCGSATGELRTLFALGLYTALRLGDCATIKWREIDLDAGIIARQPSKTKTRNGKTLLIPIHPVLHAILSETPPEQRTGYALSDVAQQYQDLNRRPKISRAIQRHFESCGIDTKGNERTDKNAPPEVSFHSMRHSFVSMAGNAGIPLPVVQELCGHESPAIQRVYMHLGETATREAILSLPDVSENGKTPTALPTADCKTELRELLEGMTAKTWKKTRAKALELL